MSHVDRRRFIYGSASLAAASTVARAESRKIKLGVIGNGGRGAWIADLFAAHGGYTVHALHDYFAERVNPVADKHNVPAARRFTGLDGYKKLIDSGVDAVAIISPPCFHPEQAATAVDAGKHVYLAKPIAVDVPGCRSVEASGKKATATGRAFLVDFQTRADPHYTEAIRRVHNGAIGTPTFGQGIYHSGRLAVQFPRNGSPGSRLRNWVFDIAMSGDIIVEQNIHTLDVMSWIMRDTPPLGATASRGRKLRVDIGDANDHYAALYQYADGVGVTFSSRQCDGFGSKPDGIQNRMFGTESVLETKYGGMVLVRGNEQKFYRGVSQAIYKDGVVANIKTFAAAIAAGDASNPTVAPSVTSNLVAILGRMAARAGRTVTWDQLMRSKETLKPNLEGLRA